MGNETILSILGGVCVFSFGLLTYIFKEFKLEQREFQKETMEFKKEQNNINIKVLNAFHQLQKTNELQQQEIKTNQKNIKEIKKEIINGK